MTRHVAGLLLFALLAVACGGSDSASDDSLAAVSGVAPASGTCLADDPDCADGADEGAAEPLPSAIALGVDGDGGPTAIEFGGFFYSDGETSQLCAALAESFPPQCASVVVDIEAGSLDTVLEHVAESFGSPEDARINIDSGIYWTDEWINLSGTLQADRLVLE